MLALRNVWKEHWRVNSVYMDAGSNISADKVVYKIDISNRLAYMSFMYMSALFTHHQFYW